MRSTICILVCCVLFQLTVSGDDAPLADAVEKQDLTAARALLDQQVEVNASQADGMTALHWAVYLDDLATTRSLIEAGAKVQSETSYGVTPISIACKAGSSKIVELLLEAGADANATLRGGETVLMTAARTGRVAPVNQLLAKGANVNATEKNGQTAIMWAAAEGHTGVVNILLEAGAEFRVPLPSGYTPLMFAIREGHTDVVRTLLASGTEVNEPMRVLKKPPRTKRPDKGTSPLMLAIENGHFELAMVLLAAGADPNDQRTGFAPLHALSWVRKPPHGDNEDGDPVPIGSGNLTSLQFAAELVKHGADVNVRKEDGGGGRSRFGKKGTTPFLCAAGTADLPLMRVLLDLGADPTISNSLNWTPLMMAAGIGSGSSADEAGTEAECMQSVNFLLELGADINHVDKNGETAMHSAAYRSFPLVIQFLVDNGADINIWRKPGKAGRTPLSIAQGYRPGNFKPSYPTVAVIERAMFVRGVMPPPPPKKKSGNY
jgi:ankyrin repeat protein